MLHRRCQLLSEETRRILAAGGIALVLLLSVLAANPELHQVFHSGANSSHDDGCAVVLFAQGVSAPFDSAVLAAVPAEWTVLIRAGISEIFVSSPRYLLLPGRGPPVS